ncbi:MAG: hypothetical protein JRF42_02280 [Deltaproteobacteria bacterium]|nr:hypothetical protein [Deltaproteobacteria bacterium]
MWKVVVCATALLWGCTGKERKVEVELPQVAPDTVVVSWSVVSRSSDRDSLHVVLDAAREMNVTNRSPDGTMINVVHTVSEKDYAKLVASLRALDCCSLRSTSKERTHPGEARPQLEINFGDVDCEIELWDREWREGLARECGFTFARLHQSGFVPDPPVDDLSQ